MYILCVTSHVSVYCLLFLVVYFGRIFCSRLETILITLCFQEIGFVFEHVSACRIVERIPLSMLLFDARNRSAVTFVDSS